MVIILDAYFIFLVSVFPVFFLNIYVYLTIVVALYGLYMLGKRYKQS